MKNQKSARKILLASLLAIMLLSAFGCARQPNNPSCPAPQRNIQQQLAINYAKKYIEFKNFEEASRFLDTITPDSPLAAEAAQLQTQVDKLAAEYDEALKTQYAKQDAVGIDLNISFKPASGDSFVVEGIAKLPRRARLIASIWKEETDGSWRKLNEEATEIGAGSRFQAVLSAYHQTAFDKDAAEKFLTGNFELKVTGCFHSPNEQPQSVMESVGPDGKKITGQWVDHSPQGNCLNYHQRFHLQTHADSGHCMNIKAEKI
jgi:hypothetical protein